MEIEFPEISKKEIHDADIYFAQKSFEKSRRKACLRDWLRERSELKEKAEE